MYNFQEVYDRLKSYGIAEKINNEMELAEKIIKNFENSPATNQKQVDLLNDYGEKILKKTFIELETYLN